jgi:hypothetical protein
MSRSLSFCPQNPTDSTLEFPAEYEGYLVMDRCLADNYRGWETNNNHNAWANRGYLDNIEPIQQLGRN